jgi:hypothetical protein
MGQAFSWFAHRVGVFLAILDLSPFFKKSPGSERPKNSRHF